MSHFKGTNNIFDDYNLFRIYNAIKAKADDLEFDPR